MDVYSLITEVSVRPTLWDRQDKNHHNRFVLDRLWEEVALKCNTTRPVVRNKWKSLRDKFRSSLASIPKSKSGDIQIDDYKGEWKYFNSILFLKDQFTPRNNWAGNVPKTDENMFFESSSLTMSQDENDHDDESEHDITHSPLEQLKHSDSVLPNVTQSSYRASISASKHRQKRSSIGRAFLQVEKRKLQVLEKKHSRNEEDEDLHFFKSLLPHVRMFSAYDKMEYRMRVMKLTQDFLKPNENSDPFANIT